MSEKPLAARCVVPAIACKALSVREESRVKCSPGPRDRCSPPPASIPALPAREAKAEQRKVSASSIPAGRPPAGQGDSKGCCQGKAASRGTAQTLRSRRCTPKNSHPRTEEVVGFGGENWVSPWEAEALKSVHLDCFMASQLLSY